MQGGNLKGRLPRPRKAGFANDDKLVPGEADGGGVDFEFTGKHIGEGFRSFHLQFGGVSRFTVSDNADTDGLSAVACTPGRNGGVLPVPSVGSLDETILGTEAVADNEVAIEVLGIREAGERSELFYVTRASAAVEDFDTVPMSGLLDERCEDGFLDGVEAIVA